MARRKKRGSVFDFPHHLIFTILGVLCLLIAVITTLALLQVVNPDGLSGAALSSIQAFLVGNFGGIAFCVPIIFFLLAGHCIGIHKYLPLSWRFTLGLVFVAFAALGFFQQGSWGELIYQNLIVDFSPIGGYAILTALAVVGIILFFDITPAHVKAAVEWVKSLFTPKAKSAEASKEKKNGKAAPVVVATAEQAPTVDEDGFIKDVKKLPVEQAVPKQKPLAAAKPQMQVKPISEEQSLRWQYPPLDLLSDIKAPADRGDTAANAAIIEQTLKSFGIKARVAEVNGGPTVTQYALEVAIGTNISDIVKKSSNLALALASSTGTVRIEAPIPGRSLVGIEIPNRKAEIVTLKRLLSSKVFTDSHDPLMVPLGLDVAGEVLASSIAKMPHVLIAGTTGSGKSVAINAWITTFLFRTKPSELRLVLVDPKQVELTMYNGVPHLLTEVITDPQRTINALRWGVAEMENRYKQLAAVGVRNIEGYNELPDVEKKPYIIFVIDELADLMMTSKSDIESLVVKIAQKARAVGIHIVLATQRPSVNVITGLMKANIPTRIAFNVASGIDSKVILDSTGAENLVGKGDMFYSAVDSAKPRRIQGPFLSDKEIRDTINFLKEKNPLVQYTEEVVVPTAPEFVGGMTGGGGNPDQDPMFAAALDLIRGQKLASASLFQRRLKVGYARAARILDELAAAGYVAESKGPGKPREVLNVGFNDNVSDEAIG